MAFSDFKTLSEVLEKFRIVYKEKDFFSVEVPLNPSVQFLQGFEFCREHIDVYLLCNSFTESRTAPIPLI